KLELARLVATGRESEQVVSLDPDLRAAEGAREAGEEFERGRPGGVAAAREAGQVHARDLRGLVRHRVASPDVGELYAAVSDWKQSTRMFGQSKAVIFEPYGRRRSRRTVPRWLVLLLSGIVVGAGGVVFVQERYLPPRLSADA